MFSLAAWLFWPPLQILIWPVVSFVIVMLLLLPAVLIVIRSDEKSPIRPQTVKTFLTSLFPLFYLAALFAVNFLVLR